MSINDRNFWPRQGDRFLLALATTNAGKVREMRAILAHLPLQICPLPEGLPEAVENGETFEENALIKARYAAAATGLPALADDSGLVADALGHEPGVYSARYAASSFSAAAWQAMSRQERDGHNINKLLAELLRVGANLPEQRRARFCCCMAMVFPDGHAIITHGAWEGHIVTKPEGINGFGYDPVFFAPGAGTVSACLTPEQKDALSHRGKALAAMMTQWTKMGVAPKNLA